MLVKIVIATAIFTLIQLAVSAKTNLFAAVIANIPVFTIFAFLSVDNGQDIRKMALYLFVMTLCISLSYLLVYIAGITNKQAAIAVFGFIWIILTIAAYISLRRFV